MPGTWVETDSKHDLEIGGTYRLTLWLNLPDSNELRQKVRDGIIGLDRFMERLPSPIREGLGGLDITKVETGLASTDNRAGRLSPWPLRITFKKIGGNTPFVVIAGWIAALLILIVGGIVIAAKQFERLSEDLKDTIFNPGLLLAGLVGIALITRKGR